jgi:hypothetical protein
MISLGELRELHCSRPALHFVGRQQHPAAEWGKITAQVAARPRLL